MTLLEVDLDGASFFGILDRIFDQVQNEFSNSKMVSKDRHLFLRKHRKDAEILVLGQERSLMNRFLKDLRQADLLAIQLDLSAIGSGQQEEIIDDLAHPVDLFEVARQDFLVFRRRSLFSEGNFHLALEDGQRRF